jgi:hypothetical protein
MFVTQLIAESSPGVQVDPTNLQVGDHVTFRLATIDETTHTYTTVSAGQLTTTDTTGAAGNLNLTTGAFVATAPTNGTTYTVSTVGKSPNYSLAYAVVPVEARVSGQVTDSNGLSVPFVVVVFKDSVGNQVGQTTATVSGSFNGSVPATATRFNLASTSYSATAYYSLFTYGTGTYGPLITTCNAPLPTVASGTTTPLPNSIVLSAVSSGGVQNEPPPPPSCSP